MSEFRLEEHPVVLLRPRLSWPYAWAGHIPFAYLLVDILRPRTLVELGADSGNSYLAFCQAVVELGTDTRCTAIDSWEGDPHARRYGEDVYETLKAYHDPRYEGFSRLFRSYFAQAVGSFADGSIDLLHIDGLHTYEAVREDFETWLPKLSDRAVVIMHDTQVRERGFGVARYLDELRTRYPVAEFEHSNGLGIVQVGANPPATFTAFMRAFAERPAPIRGFFSRLGQALVDTGDTPARAGAAERVSPGISCRVYYREANQGYDDSRVLIADLGDASGPLDLRFAFPDAVRPAFLRVDPADHAGVFELRGLSVEDPSGVVRVVQDLAERVVSTNGDRVGADDPAVVRVVSFSDDPQIELRAGDLFQAAGVSGSATITLRVMYEAVANDPVLWTVARAQHDALAEVKRQMQQGPSRSLLAGLGTMAAAMQVAGIVALDGRGPRLYRRDIGEAFSDERVAGHLVGLDDAAVVRFPLPAGRVSSFVRLDIPALPGCYRLWSLQVDGRPVPDLARRVLHVHGQRVEGAHGEGITIAAPDGPPHVELDLSDLAPSNDLQVSIARDLRLPWRDQRIADTLVDVDHLMEQAGQDIRALNALTQNAAEATGLRVQRATGSLAGMIDGLRSSNDGISNQIQALQEELSALHRYERNRNLFMRALRRLRRMFK